MTKPKTSKANRADLIRHIVEQIKEGERAMVRHEKYGLRSVTQNGITGEIVGENSPLEQAIALNSHALELLKWGEKFSLKLENDLGNVAAREGVLSPRATALEFLQAQRALFSAFLERTPESPFSGLDLFQEQVFRLCKAWHWLHMDLFGEHSKAVAGVRSKAGKEKGALRNKTKSERQEQIIEELIRPYLAKDDSTARASTNKSIATQIEGELRAMCKKGGLKALTLQGRLPRTVGKIRRRLKIS